MRLYTRGCVLPHPPQKSRREDKIVENMEILSEQVNARSVTGCFLIGNCAFFCKTLYGAKQIAG